MKKCEVHIHSVISFSGYTFLKRRKVPENFFEMNKLKNKCPKVPNLVWHRQ